MSTVQDLVTQLEKLGYRVTPPKPLTPPRRCSVCGAVELKAVAIPNSYDMTNISDDTEVSEYLTQIVVQTNIGEEGYDKVVRFFCEDHDYEAILALEALGYVSHHHGGTASLQDSSCPGYEDMDACPHGRQSPYNMDDDGLYIEPHW